MLLPWGGAWKADAWAPGAWVSTDSTPEPPPPQLGPYGGLAPRQRHEPDRARQRRERLLREDRELLEVITLAVTRILR